MNFITYDEILSYKPTGSDDQKYIVSTVTGDLTKEITGEQMADLYKLANEVGISNFLIDLAECRFVGSTIEQYKYASSDVPDYGNVN